MGSRSPREEGKFRGEVAGPRTCPDMAGVRDTQSDSAGGSTGTVRILIGVYRMGCTLAQPGEYD